MLAEAEKSTCPYSAHVARDIYFRSLLNAGELAEAVAFAEATLERLLASDSPGVGWVLEETCRLRVELLELMTFQHRIAEASELISGSGTWFGRSRGTAPDTPVYQELHARLSLCRAIIQIETETLPGAPQSSGQTNAWGRDTDSFLESIRRRFALDCNTTGVGSVLDDVPLHRWLEVMRRNLGSGLAVARLESLLFYRAWLVCDEAEMQSHRSCLHDIAEHWQLPSTHPVSQILLIVDYWWCDKVGAPVDRESFAELQMAAHGLVRRLGGEHPDARVARLVVSLAVGTKTQSSSWLQPSGILEVEYRAQGVCGGLVTLMYLVYLHPRERLAHVHELASEPQGSFIQAAAEGIEELLLSVRDLNRREARRRQLVEESGAERALPAAFALAYIGRVEGDSWKAAVDFARALELFKGHASFRAWPLMQRSLRVCRVALERGALDAWLLETAMTILLFGSDAGDGIRSHEMWANPSYVGYEDWERVGGWRQELVACVEGLRASKKNVELASDLTSGLAALVARVRARGEVWADGARVARSALRAEMRDALGVGEYRRARAFHNRLLLVLAARPNWSRGKSCMTNLLRLCAHQAEVAQTEEWRQAFAAAFNSASAMCVRDLSAPARSVSDIASRYFAGMSAEAVLVVVEELRMQQRENPAGMGGEALLLRIDLGEFLACRSHLRRIKPSVAEMALLAERARMRGKWWKAFRYYCAIGACEGFEFVHQWSRWVAVHAVEARALTCIAGASEWLLAQQAMAHGCEGDPQQFWDLSQEECEEHNYEGWDDE
ncbi:MAG: hypothetical protein U0Q55_00070 [Vicinamibacterales bacterium]